MLYKNALELIGNTPMIKINKLDSTIKHLNNEIYIKVEMSNLTGSVKDRIALKMIEDLEVKGILKPGCVIIEPTSGNTGIGIAAVASLKNYRCIITMPETMSVERRRIMAAYGAELVLTEGPLGMAGAIAKAKELESSIENAIILSQFDNPSNPKMHEETTANEIFKDLNGQIDIIVAGIGTGGTISGIAHNLKPRLNKLKLIGVEPSDSPIITKGTKGPHKIQGIGAGFIPENLDLKLIDEVVTVTNQQAYDFAKLLVKNEGVFAGISSGAALAATFDYIEKYQIKNQKIVVILPDTGLRYLSDSNFID